MEINIAGKDGRVKAKCWLIFPYRFGNHSTEFFAITQESGRSDYAITHYFSGLRITESLQDEDEFLIDPNKVTSAKLEQVAMAQLDRTFAKHGVVRVLQIIGKVRKEVADNPVNDDDI